MTKLLAHFESLLHSNKKLLVPYLMGGFPQVDAYPETLTAVSEHADAVEIGLPYSDPLMDGPVIASAGERVISAGVGPNRALDLTADVETRVPRIVMTYYNPIHRMGEADFCARVIEAGFSGLIVPDLPLEESGSLRAIAAEGALAWIGLVAPTSSLDRVAAAAAASTGFIYAVSTLGVTGTRDALADSAQRVVAACRSTTELPVLLGIGVSNAEQARLAAETADGVVIGSAVLRAVLERGPEAAREFLGGVRRSLDSL